MDPLPALRMERRAGAHLERDIPLAAAPLAHGGPGTAVGEAGLAENRVLVGDRPGLGGLDLHGAPNQPPLDAAQALHGPPAPPAQGGSGQALRILKKACPHRSPASACPAPAGGGTAWPRAGRPRPQFLMSGVPAGPSS